MPTKLSDLRIYDLGPVDADGRRLLYVPLADSSALVDAAELSLLQAVAEGTCDDAEAADTLRQLSEHEPVARIRSVADFRNLSILPTNACNFACSYCYSARSRSPQTLSWPQVERAIGWFIGIERPAPVPLHITLFGGGEPMLCWESIVRPAIELVEELRKDYPAPIHITLITNGSILPADFADICLRARIDLAVSFELLPELQNAQRRNYDRVLANLRALLAAGVVPAINSVITDLAVNRMPDMVRAAARDLPGVRYLAFEPATQPHTPEFYRAFTDGFLEARDLAEAKGMMLSTSALRNCDVTVERYCAGELALAPAGDLTLCPCISAPDQSGYDRWTYGRVTDESIEIDTERLARLLALDVDSQPWCRDCFARYNCGGGCINNTAERGNKPDAAYCDFFRNFLRRVILTRTL